MDNLNTLSFTGTVIKHGITSGKFPKLWILVKLENGIVKNPNIVLSENTMFVNVNIDTNKTTKKGQQTESLKKKLENSKFIQIVDATLANIKRSVKVGDDWQETIDTGIQASITNIHLSSESFQNINIGMLQGIIKVQDGNKILISQKYRVPSTDGPGAIKEREIPMYLDTDIAVGNVVDKFIIAAVQVAGITPDKTQKVYAISRQFSIYE